MAASTSPPIDNRSKRTIVVIALVLVGILIWLVAGALPLIVIALVIAFLLNPLTTFLERRVLRRLPGARSWAILLTYLLVFLLFIVLILIIIPSLFRQIADFAAELPAQLDTLQTQLREWLSQPFTFNGEVVLINGEPFVPYDQLVIALGENPTSAVIPEDFDVIGAIREGLGSVTAPTFRILGGAFTRLINSVLLLTMMFYLLKDGALFVNSIIGAVPPDFRVDARQIALQLRDVWNAYLRGQLILSSFIGIVVTAAATALGIPNAPVLGVISFALEFVPNIGPLIALIPARLLALLSESATIPGLSGIGFALVVVIVWTIIQNIQAIFVTPRVMGDSLDLHPIVVIVGVILGARLSGVLGVILAAPMIASARVIGGYFYRKILDMPPFPDPIEDPAEESSQHFIARIFGRGRPSASKQGAAAVVQSPPLIRSEIADEQDQEGQKP